jgi:electron transfer flavoprotein alpha subunit
MSESILCLAHVEQDGTLAKAALEAVGASVALGEALGSPLAIGLVGSRADAAAASVGGCGALHVFAVTDPRFDGPRYATDVAAAEALARAAGATLVLAPATSRWLRVLAGVSHRLGGSIDTHATAVEATGGRVSVTRWFYRQRIEAVLVRAARPWVIALEPGAPVAWSGAPGAVHVEPVAVDLAPETVRTEVVGVESPAADAQTIRPDASLLFVAGAGWTKKQSDGHAHAAEAADLILGFLDRSKASLGGSKSLVDQSGEGEAVLPFMTHLNQVGQTGATPRHPKGLATCCHGEEPHVVGWRFIGERRAVNLDPNCGWARGKADVVYVADAFAVMRKVNERL